ncbi:MAG TPA: hypothetical protein VGU61_14455 [Noviherbaspirillum sp.]|uniref:hypothetical protein n=1 Tax=Noviherbaspirillum sp. TaxID=1926288 RepID=UPI002DDDA75F|nr:hypothetical protein [Noviherbaspirillum sp.]HEV2611468.1 hypothetical protein [Noviherbaspirillum sp.]
MNISRMSIVLSAAVLFMAGCQKASEPPTPVTSSAAGSTSSSTSVAAPPSAMPSSDATMKPAAPGSTGSSGDAQSPTQANPSTLSKQEEKTAMPQSGQVNNHSVPDTTGEKK